MPPAAAERCAAPGAGRLRGRAVAALLAAAVWAAGCERPNPQSVLDAALLRVAREQSASAYADALLAAERANAVTTLADLARQAAHRFPQADGLLRSGIALGLWTAGDYEAAEALVDGGDDSDHGPGWAEVRMLIEFGRGNEHEAVRLAELAASAPLFARTYVAAPSLLARTGRREATERCVADLRARLASGGARYTALSGQLSAIAALVDAANGAEWNQLAAPGVAPMPHNTVLALPEVNVFLNGVGPFRFVLDTGAGEIVAVGPRAAEAAELVSDADIVVWGFGGAQPGGATIVDRMTVGDIECRNVVTQIGGSTMPMLVAVDGLIGTGVFRSACVTLDFAAAELRVDAGVAAQAGVESIPFRLSPSAHVFLRCALDGEPVSALLDSGANVALVSPEWLARHRPDSNGPPIDLPMLGVGGGGGARLTGSLGELAIGATRLPDFAAASHADLDGALADGFGMRVDFVLGMPVLRRMESLTLDYPRRRLSAAWIESD